ncbi:hypothetical protein BDW02DRAFT_223968 [Decorospora gaudefroyi]|uniref:Uncharacterized protein n=1 Tax=Decorospora gaudefroyi TaxID=184978 RepID=A0A6A5JX62_9PLEO|nr:hypothetical protein BDW02DRAFT_223968 [Decorospora gaudefroyi]
MPGLHHTPEVLIAVLLATSPQANAPGSGPGMQPSIHNKVQTPSSLCTHHMSTTVIPNHITQTFPCTNSLLASHNNLNEKTSLPPTSQAIQQP